MSAPVTYRRFRPGDEEAINAGFELAFHTRRELAEWCWKYQADADARAIYIAVTTDGRVLAHFAGIREWLHVDGREFRVAQTVDVYALPEARRSLAGASVYLETAKAFFREYLAPNDLAAVYGFPGPRHEPLLIRRLDCVRVQPVKVWDRTVDRRWPWRTAHDVRTGWDPAAIDEVWRRAAPRYPVALRRDAARRPAASPADPVSATTSSPPGGAARRMRSRCCAPAAARRSWPTCCGTATIRVRWSHCSAPPPAWPPPRATPR